MRQLTLDIRPEESPDFAAFVPGANGEALEHLRDLACPHHFGSLYLWGEAGSGCSHLLRATAATARAQGRPVEIRAAAEIADDLPLPSDGLLIIDEVEQLGSAAQIALFRAYNSARFINLALLVAGPVPPLELALREDLRTRIGQSLIYQIHPLSDEDKAETLRLHAKGRGFELAPELIGYLLRHGRRDLGFLLAVVDALDEQTLVQKRPVSLPMLREILSGGEGAKDKGEGQNRPCPTPDQRNSDS